MKILQLAKKFPFPIKDGESIAVTSLSRALTELGCEVSLLAMNTAKHFYEAKSLPLELCHYSRVDTAPVDNRIKWWDAFVNLFSRESYHISRFQSPAFRQQLIRQLKENDYELIQLETLYLAPYIATIRQYSDAVIAMRAHNVEHEIWERIAQNTRLLPKKWYLKHLAAKLKRYEMERLFDYDLLVPISQRDQLTFQSMGSQTPSIVTPIGIDPESYRPDYQSFQRELSIGFIGSLDWMPNQEGLLWFLDKVWSRLSQQFPRLKLHIAGRNTPDWLLRYRLRNVVVHGEVPDAAAFINTHSLMVVPLLSGSGMRAKILEGMALGKVVLTTSLGLEGIPAGHGDEVLVADSTEDFVRAIRFCYQQGGHLERLGRKAREFVARQYDGQHIAKRLLHAYASLTVEAI